MGVVLDLWLRMAPNDVLDLLCCALKLRPAPVLGYVLRIMKPSEKIAMETTLHQSQTIHPELAR